MFVIYFAEAGFLNSRGCSAVIKDDPCWFCRNYSEAFLHAQKKKETQTWSAVEINSLNVWKQLSLSALPVGIKQAFLTVQLEYLSLMTDLYFSNY